jgi:hypothetical protein
MLAQSRVVELFGVRLIPIDVCRLRSSNFTIGIDPSFRRRRPRCCQRCLHLPEFADARILLTDHIETVDARGQHVQTDKVRSLFLLRHTGSPGSLICESNAGPKEGSSWSDLQTKARMSNSLEASEGIVDNGKRGGASPACSRSESEFLAGPVVKERTTIAA